MHLYLRKSRSRSGGVLALSLTACPERLLSELIKESFEVPAYQEEGDELSAEGSAKTDSAFEFR